MAYDQIVLIPGGGAEGTGAREILDLLAHPEAAGVTANDPRWRGWTSSSYSVAGPVIDTITEATVGYGERAEVLQEIDRMLAGIQVPIPEVVPVFIAPARRRGWTRLTKDYRRRLEGRGITRERWEAGADLRSARGHAPRAPRGAADLDVTMRYLSGPRGRGPSEQRILREFNQLRRPGWIPAGMSDDVVAALSQLRSPPSRWSAVRFVPAPDGEPWAMIVSFK